MLSRIVISFVALTSILLNQSSTFGQENRQPATTPTIAAIDAAMQKFVDDKKIAGAVTLVAQKGRIAHLGAVGTSDIESQKVMRPSTLFSIASMTKPITATAVMILQDEGKLDIDDKVSKHLPSFAQLKLENGQPLSREITIRDAITHTAGLAGTQVFSGSLEEAVDELSERPLAFQPGTRWQYSPGLNVAGRIVEVVSGMSFESFLEERIFKPLRMHNTSFAPNKRRQRRIATIYQPGDEPGTLAKADNFITDYTDVRGPNPSGGLFSTARDMFRFYRMVLRGGRFRNQQIVSKDAVRQMTSPQTGELKTGFTPGNCWGLGWCIIRQPQGVTGMLSPGTFGHGGAFGTQGWVDPKTEAIHILMIQRTNFGNSDGSNIRATFQQVASDHLKR